MMGESMDAIMELLTSDEPVNRKTDWFELVNARLQLKSFTDPHLPIAVASVQSPAGVELAGRYGVGVITVGTRIGVRGAVDIAAQWRIAEENAAANGKTMNRADWRISVPVHLADSRKEAIADVRATGGQYYVDYMQRALGQELPPGPSDAIIEHMMESGSAVIGTEPDDLIAAIERSQETTSSLRHPPVLTTIVRRAELVERARHRRVLRAAVHARVLPAAPGRVRAPRARRAAARVRRDRGRELPLRPQGRRRRAALQRLGRTFGFSAEGVALLARRRHGRSAPRTCARACRPATSRPPPSRSAARTGSTASSSGATSAGASSASRRRTCAPTSGRRCPRTASTAATSCVWTRPGAPSDAPPLGVAAISIGTNPTFEVRQRRVEAYILDFDGDLYGDALGFEQQPCGGACFFFFFFFFFFCEQGGADAQGRRPDPPARPALAAFAPRSHVAGAFQRAHAGQRCHPAGTGAAITALAVGGIVTVADNGLAFTAVAEIAGSAWSGRALGIQNTGQNVVASLTPIVLGTLVGAAGYAVGFAVAAVAPAAAIALTPVRDEPEASW